MAAFNIYKLIYFILNLHLAIITYHFPESTLPLAKNLAETGCEVDYYFILRYKASKSIPGFDISNSKLHIGINKLTPVDAPETFAYLGNAAVNIFIIYYPPKPNMALIKNLFAQLVFTKINAKNYHFINVVGQDPLLINFHIGLKNVKRVHTLHEVNDHYQNLNLNNPLLEYLFKEKIKIIVHSKESYNKICLYKAAHHKIIFEIPFGLFETYLNYEPEYLIDKKTKYVLFFGYIHAYKGLDTLLASINLLSEDDIGIKFVIAGSGTSVELNDLKNNKHCIVINRHLTNNELVGLNKNAQFVVCPYKSASQSGIIMTSFLFGRPIIASNVGAFSEVIDDGINGILIKPNSPIELEIAIKTLCNDDEILKKMQSQVGVFSKKTAYNWHNIAYKTKEVYLMD